MELTDTEFDVLLFLSEGLSQVEIAAERNLTPVAVKKHVEIIRAKFGAKNSAHIVSLAYQSGTLMVRK